MASWWRRLIPSKNDRELARLRGEVEAVAALEPALQKLDDDGLRQQTALLRQAYQDGLRQLAGGDVPALDDLDRPGRTRLRGLVDRALMPLRVRAFAVVREAARRVLGMRHYDVQILGGLVLHEGRIAEMKTGEGKTLVATLPVYLNALSGLGVYVVTVNEYLASRDAAWMGQLYRFLDLEVGVITHGLGERERQAAYRMPITYGTNSEFGFDYLRDNMKLYLRDYVQRGNFFAIVDEVDSILIDEARTPLIISGPAEQSTATYGLVAGMIPSLRRERDFTVDEKARAVMLTEAGVHTVEARLSIDNLYEPEHLEMLHHVNQALRAHTLYHRDIDYMVENGRVKIIDEFTGRVLEGRRWSDGLHQAVEAKEQVPVENENQTLATITYQNLFRNFVKLSGMTGTAQTEAEEFAKIYDLEVVVIPTNRPMCRTDLDDVIYKTEREKFAAIVEEIQERTTLGQPVLVGTISVEKSEILSRHLARLKVPHAVLNAKYHRQEAEIIAQAGRKSAVTIATNMAGRGTDILLGGNPHVQARTAAAAAGEGDAEAAVAARLPAATAACEREKQEVVDAGGLHILGTERHESRRIDNQLRGRAGRQGDPGSSRFYICMEDNLIRIFGGDTMVATMERLGMQDGEVIESSFINRRIEDAQRRVEGRNFDIRKHLLEYDDVMNDQRGAIYRLRRRVIRGELAETREQLLDLTEDVVIGLVSAHAPEDRGGDGVDVHALAEAASEQFTQAIWGLSAEQGREELENQIFGVAKAGLDKREEQFTQAALYHVGRVIYLQAIDAHWKDHLREMDQLREGISLRGYAQKDPKQEYKKEGYNLFSAMMAAIAQDVLAKVFRVVITAEVEAQVDAQAERRQAARLRQMHENAATSEAPEPTSNRAQPARRDGGKVGSNDPCPCGSGKKYKKCHMHREEEVKGK